MAYQLKMNFDATPFLATIPKSSYSLSILAAAVGYLIYRVSALTQTNVLKRTLKKERKQETNLTSGL
jgi:hypothetical protein